MDMADIWKNISQYSLPLLRSKWLWTSVPIVTPILYVLWFNHVLSRNVESSSGPYMSGELDSASLPPPEMPADDPDTLVFHENVVKTVAKSAIQPKYLADMDLLLTDYVRGNMHIFSRLPTTAGMRRLMSDPRDRATFDTLYLNNLEFVPGDRVAGIFRIVRREEGRRIELLMDAPESYRGDAVKGIMIMGFHTDKAQAHILVENDVWMWRKRDEPSAPIERGIGKRLHTLFVKWLIDKQMRQLNPAI